MMQRLITIIALLSLSLTAFGCQETGQPASSDRPASPTYRSAPEGTLRVGGIHTLDGFDTKNAIRLEANGKTVRIDTLALVVSAVELHACRPAETPESSDKPGPTRINFDLTDLFVGTAHAHTPGSSTRLGTPIARDLAGPGGRARIVGEIAPPLGSYCRVFATLAPADDDLNNLTSLTIQQLLGHSLVIKGRWRTSETSDWTPFTLTSNATASVGFDAIDPNTGEPPIRFASPSDVTLALLQTDLHPDIFRGLPDALPTPDSATADTILKRIAHSLRLHQFE
jgi:hypothetical protein